jgi:hypothetical protein
MPVFEIFCLKDVEGNIAVNKHVKTMLKREVEENIRIATKRQQESEMDFASKCQSEKEIVRAPCEATVKYVDSHVRFKKKHTPSLPLRGVTQAGESSVPCHCGNTKCLRMYCGCFKRGELCSKRCTCFKCANVSVLDKRRIEAVKRVHYIKAKEWHRPAVYQDSFLDDSKLNLDANVVEGTVTRVCACVNSGCNKKYCICYRNGTKCTEICTCITCYNK